jgi:aspartyl-tRNA(Asn)/glutamyl-tRNA(Gln) amidotransferase subunit B
MTMHEGFEMVVGLEVHTELKTATKLFCGCPNAFGAAPNTNVCPVCLGLPGSLPVLNRGAVELAMAIGSALGCAIRPSSFHRKNYFYPDMPKDYQISQYDEPINVGGALELPDGSTVGIERAHLEEDTGKTTHVGASGRIHGAERSLVDYNRAGVPLVEIVSDPDVTSAAQARAYAAELRSILVATGASDGRMEEGSMRVDANVSVRRTGDATLGTRCEIKNLNSLRSVQRAVEHEAERQSELLAAGGRVVQETRHWDEGEGTTISMRSKEEAYDYRYFPEPDLLPLVPEDAWRDRVAAGLPALPAARRATLVALIEEPTASQRDQVLSVVELGLDAMVTSAVSAGVDATRALARVANEVAAIQGAAGLDVDGVVKILVMEQEGLSATQAKTVLADFAERGGDPRELAAERGFEQLDAGSLDATIDELIGAFPDEWTRYRQGDDKLGQFFVGQVMKLTKGQADGKAVIAGLVRRR